jgi:hypothetical protein
MNKEFNCSMQQPNGEIRKNFEEMKKFSEMQC